MAALARTLQSRYLGNPHIFTGKWALALEERSAIFAKVNNILYVAPMVKWALSIVPITLAVTGTVQVDKIDIKTSAALMTTGIVWTYYGFLLRKNNAGMAALMGVNAAMAIVHGTNTYRAWKYQNEKKKAAAV